MDTHVKVLGWLHILLNVPIFLLGLFFFLGSVLVGGAFLGGPQGFAFPLFGAIGALVLLFIFILSVPGIIVGWALITRVSWGRVLGIVVSILDLINFPVGTALGVYGLIVLFDPRTVLLFEGQGSSLI